MTIDVYGQELHVMQPLRADSNLAIKWSEINLQIFFDFLRSEGTEELVNKMHMKKNSRTLITKKKALMTLSELSVLVKLPISMREKPFISCLTMASRCLCQKLVLFCNMAIKP